MKLTSIFCSKVTNSPTILQLLIGQYTRQTKCKIVVVDGRSGGVRSGMFAPRSETIGGACAPGALRTQLLQSYPERSIKNIILRLTSLLYYNKFEANRGFQIPKFDAKQACRMSRKRTLNRKLRRFVCVNTKLLLSSARTKKSCVVLAPFCNDTQL